MSLANDLMTMHQGVLPFRTPFLRPDEWVSDGIRE
jgi:hypothetical protein